jgi:hypothetical protein
MLSIGKWRTVSELLGIGLYVADPIPGTRGVMTERADRRNR